MRLADRYAKFRGSKAFLVALCTLIFLWVALNLCPLFKWDDGFGELNLILSSEASISVALLIMAQDKQDELQKKQMLYIQHLLEATIELIEKQK